MVKGSGSWAGFRCEGRSKSLLVVAFLVAVQTRANAQTATRLLLSTGGSVPGHAGFVFGPFSRLAMNEAKEIVFLSSLRSARTELPAVVRSVGVTFSVVAFQGLRSPVPKTTYQSFSAPSMNGAGVVAFTAQLKDDVPTSTVVRVEGMSARAIATSGDNVPGLPGATFQEFSAPLVNSAGDILFGARTAGKSPGTGLFLWTARGIHVLSVPAELKLTPKDLLEPLYFSRDEAVLVPGGSPSEAAIEQFFRAVAVRSSQSLTPSPERPETVEVLPARPTAPRIRMLLVIIHSENVQMVPLVGDPSQAVLTKAQPGVTVKPLGRILGQTSGERGNIIFAATAAGQENDLGLYCLCNGQVVRLTTPEEFAPIVAAAGGKPIVSLTGDAERTLGFIAPSAQGGDSTSIYVTSLP